LNLPGKTVCRITALLNRSISKEVIDALREAGVIDLLLIPARSPVMERKRTGWSLFTKGAMSEDPVDILFFIVDKEMEIPLLHLIAEKALLHFPGRGSVFSEEVKLALGHDLCQENRVALPQTETSVHVAERLAGVFCIVQRGNGDHIARIPLESGISVPSIHFGIGKGVRDKMGLLRITIPADKEIIYTLASAYDTDLLMDRMIEVAKLDQPGKGFIYEVPIKRGVINMKVTRGDQHQAASIEQLVAAVDQLKGGAEWRRRSASLGKKGLKKRNYIHHLVDFTLLCDGGTGVDLVKKALSAGAAGATIAHVKHIRPADSPLSALPPVREECNMAVTEDQIDSILSALQGAGAFTDDCHGQVQLRRVLRAFTYFPK